MIINLGCILYFRGWQFIFIRYYFYVYVLAMFVEGDFIILYVWQFFSGMVFYKNGVFYCYTFIVIFFLFYSGLWFDVLLGGILCLWIKYFVNIGDGWGFIYMWEI